MNIIKRRHRFDLQSVYRLMFIPWLVVLSIVGDLANYEKYGHVEFVGWLNANDNGLYVHYLELKQNHPYRLVMFTQKSNLLDDDIMLAKSEIKSPGDEVVVITDYSSGGRVLNAGSLAMLLGKHASELVDDKDEDPHYHNKFIKSTRIFEVDSAGVYTVRTRIERSVESWKKALLVNVEPDNKWYYLQILLFFYGPFFVLQELYYFVKRIYTGSRFQVRNVLDKS